MISRTPVRAHPIKQMMDLARHRGPDDEGYLIKKVIRGTTVGEATERARYEKSLLHDGFRRLINQRVKDGELSDAEGADLAQFYESRYDAYTYLAVNGAKTRSRRSTDF